MKISVVLAAYKGEKYIAAQLESVLKQLGEGDEVIVSDDFPHGQTAEAVSPFCQSDPRVRYVTGPGKGVTANFENAMSLCTGDIIFLCDQDDVWLDGKVDCVVSAIKGGADLVLHDASVTDKNLNITEESYFKAHSSCNGLIKNLVRNSFVGCCMAFTADVMRAALPLPENVPMHDWWIALCAMKLGFKVELIDRPLILWRRHGENVTGGATSAKQKIMWRLNLLGALIKIQASKK